MEDLTKQSYKEIIKILIDNAEYSNINYVLEETNSKQVLFVKKPVIDFLNMHNVENNNGKYYILNNIKYKYLGIANKQRTGKIENNE